MVLPAWWQKQLDGNSILLAFAFHQAWTTCSGRTGRAGSRAVLEYCWLSRLVLRMAPNQGPSVFPITLPTALGDALSWVHA